VAKNKRLLDEVTKLRVSWEELSAQHAKAEDAIESLQIEVARQKGLNEKLENDLMGLDGKVDRGTPVLAQGSQGLAGLDIGGKPVSPLSCSEP
jgi:homeobox protein cut-like